MSAIGTARLVPLLGVVALALSGCFLEPGQPTGPVDQNVENIGGIRFWQEQAVEGFDDSTYTLTDEQVGAYRDLLIAHDIDPGGYRPVEVDGCTGGITTRAQLWFQKNGSNEMIIHGCGAADGSFEQEATDFFSAIRSGS